MFNPGEANLSVNQSVSPVPAVAGTPLTYTITVTNGGPAAATGVTLNPGVPAGATGVVATATQGTCALVAGQLVVRARRHRGRRRGCRNRDVRPGRRRRTRDHRLGHGQSGGLGHRQQLARAGDDDRPGWGRRQPVDREDRLAGSGRRWRRRSTTRSSSRTPGPRSRRVSAWSIRFPAGITVWRADFDAGCLLDCRRPVAVQRRHAQSRTKRRRLRCRRPRARRGSSSNTAVVTSNEVELTPVTTSRRRRP